MAASAIVTVRIEVRLLAALKAAAQREGGTVSSSIVEMVRAKVGPVRARKARPTMGMFAGQFEDLELADFKRARSEASARLLRSVKKPRR